MKLKNKLILLGITMGVISCFGLNNLQASEITSVFSGETITRETVQNVSLTSELNTDLVLGISKTRESGNWYTWNPKTDAIDSKGNLIVDKYGNVQVQKVWKIAKYASETSTVRDYSNSYYCLNFERGFGMTNGEMAEGAKDIYPDSFNMKDSTKEGTIADLAGGNLDTNYNKILGILESSYISTKDLNYQKAEEYKKLMNAAKIEIDEDERLNLTEDDIEVVQQMAIWYFTNTDNSDVNKDILPSLYLNGTQLTHLYFGTDEYGSQITGSYRQNKAEKLYNYFITSALNSYSPVTPTLTLNNTNTKVNESGDYYIVGPFELTKSGTTVTDLLLKLNNVELSNSDYIVTSSTLSNTNITNYDSLNTFYLKINKNKVNTDAEITIEAKGEYSVKKLTFLTDANDSTDTQAIALIENEKKNNSAVTNANIDLINVAVEKVWDDKDDQDRIRPNEVTVNLLANGTKIKDIKLNNSNEWKYTFEKLLKSKDGKTIAYTVTENPVSKYITSTAGNENDGFIITNKYTPSKVSKIVIKEWVDGNNGDGIRPDKIEVELYKIENGQEVTVDKRELYESNNWTYTWNNLDEKANGEKIVYGIKEVGDIEGYVTTYSATDYSNTDIITITNTHISTDLSIQIQKVDEEGNIINSSEAEFEIKGTQNLTDETNKGKLDLDSQTLSNNFEYIYTIKEIKAPIGYNQIVEELNVKISGIAKTENGRYVVEDINFTDKDGNALDTSKISAEYNRDLNKVIIKIVNTRVSNGYSVNLVKVKEDGVTQLEGAAFIVNNGQPKPVTLNGIEIDSGVLNSENLNDKNEIELEYILKEQTAPNGYIKIAEPKTVKIKAKVELVDNTYEITEVHLIDELDEISVSEENNVITIKVKNEPIITGKYNVVLRKVDENGNKLPGSEFEMKRVGSEEWEKYSLVNGEVKLYDEDIELYSTDDIELLYNIKETKAPTGYIGIEETKINITAEVEKEGNRYYITEVIGTFDGEENSNVTVTLEGNTIVITVKNVPEKEFDLALRKFITKINDETYSREPIVDTSKLGTVVDGKKVTTATYKHSKQPIAVQKGDIVTYTIRVYNEGEIDGYVESITDHLPDHLLPIITGVDGIDEEKYAKEIEFNEDRLWLQVGDEKTVITTITSKDNSDLYSEYTGLTEVTDTKLDAYVEGSDKLDYIDVQIKCLVTDSAVGGEYLTNIAEITDAQDINGVKGDGFDSELNNVDHSNLSDYKNNEAINSTTESYVPGQEDDDDFEKLVVKEFDLALRKFITKVNETTHSREPKVDTSKLGTVVGGKTITTATYVHTKEPVIVETSDLVTYKIRIYNEGTIAGFANEITDDIPEGLEFLPDSDINVSYRWEILDKDGKETDDVTKAVMIVTDYLSDRDSKNIIREVVEENGEKTLSYKDVEVQFKVIAKAEKLEDNLIINEAQISADSDRDIDSDPNRDEKYDYTTGNNEDDIDYEPIKLQYFDLALRKFITKVNSTDYNNRYPEIKFNDDGSITYNHTKDPVLVKNGDTVIYTIRVYNEGEKSGFATEIKDNLPEGLAFDPNNETNKLYGWKMIDKDGNETQEAEKVIAFKTNYLENEKIDALVEKNGLKVLDYKDVQIAFVVTESNKSDRILVNTAQISADSDDDIDSVPDNSVESEDDIDKEYVKVQYFDLALKKWVTETRVTLDGKTTTTKTGFTEDKEGIAKVDIVANKLKKTTVKFVYNIKVTNEGKLPGYVYEVKDYIPDGLKFVAEDNKNWKEVKDNVVVTDQLKDTLLNPGESATVEIVLTWKNSSTNLGLKTNYAEISKDSEEDIDSIPDNYDFTEDDIDDAQVILSIKTAGKTTYIGLVLISISILAGGIFLIKKYVLD